MNENGMEAKEDERYADLAEWAETADIGPDAHITKPKGPKRDTRSLRLRWARRRQYDAPSESLP